MTACVYGGLAVSCLVAPAVLRLAGLKPTLFAGCLGATAVLVSRIAPSKYLVIPAAAMMGLTQGPFLVAQGAYVASIATRLSVFGNYDLDLTLFLFSGTYFAWTFSGLFVHNALEVALLKPAADSNYSVNGSNFVQHPLNILTAETRRQQSTATNHSVADTHTVLSADDVGEVHYRMLALLGCYTLFSLAGFLLVALAVMPINATGGATIEERPSLGRVANSVFRKVCGSRLTLLIPLMLCSGLNQMLALTMSDNVSIFAFNCICAFTFNCICAFTQYTE